MKLAAVALAWGLLGACSAQGGNVEVAKSITTEELSEALGNGHSWMACSAMAKANGGDWGFSATDCKNGATLTAIERQTSGSVHHYATERGGTCEASDSGCELRPVQMGMTAEVVFEPAGADAPRTWTVQFTRDYRLSEDRFVWAADVTEAPIRPGPTVVHGALQKFEAECEGSAEHCIDDYMDTHPSNPELTFDAVSYRDVPSGVSDVYEKWIEQYASERRGEVVEDEDGNPIDDGTYSPDWYALDSPGDYYRVMHQGETVGWLASLWHANDDDGSGFTLAVSPDYRLVGEVEFLY